MNKFYFSLFFTGVLVFSVHAEENLDIHTMPSSEDQKIEGIRPSHENALYMDLMREIDLSQRERNDQRSLGLMQDELEKKMQELDGVKKNLSDEIQKKVEANDNLKLMVSLYETLDASQAADLLKRLPASISMTMLKMMVPKKASKVLAAMEPKIAAEMSRRMIQAPNTTIIEGAQQ